MAERSELRFLDQALSAPYAQGVSIGFDETGLLRFRFVVRDPTGEAEYVVIQQVVVDPTATEAILNKLNAEYLMRSASESEADPDEPVT